MPCWLRVGKGSTGTGSLNHSTIEYLKACPSPPDSLNFRLIIRFPHRNDVRHLPDQPHQSLPFDMSIFAKIKGAKKAAEKHKQAKASEVPAERKDAPVPYRHVPTHAAVDALTGAPSSWREEDRAAIQHQHKRRSMMTRNSSTLSGTLHPSSSYTGSDFSNYGMMPAASSSRPSPTRLDTRKSYQGTGHYQPSPLGSNGRPWDRSTDEHC